MPTRYQPALDLLDRFLQERLVPRIWDRDIGAWGAAPGSAEAEVHRHAAWLARHRAKPCDPTSSGSQRSADAARAGRIEAVYLLGMGGSSLCAEVAQVRPRASPKAHPQLYVLDTTDEQTLHTVAAA